MKLVLPLINIEIIRLKSNYYSASIARFVGLRYVNSEYVQFLDGDMTLDKDWIKNSSYEFLDRLTEAAENKISDNRGQKESKKIKTKVILVNFL